MAKPPPAPKVPAEKFPTNPVPRYANRQYQPPAPDWYLVKVQTGDNFVTLAAQGGCANAAELVQKNFRTTDPLIINYYLREYVGCKQLSPDGTSYSFTGAADPGFIYTPQYVDRSGNQMPTLYKQVQAALSMGNTLNYLNFRLQDHYVRPWIYSKVLWLVNKGWIKLGINKDLPGDGRYIPGANRLEFREVGLSHAHMAMVVHEATHAAFDYLGSGQGMRRDTSELLAYTAQNVFFQLATGQNLAGSGSEVNVFNAATTLAAEIVSHKLQHQDKIGDAYMPKEEPTQGLLAAIRACPLYKDNYAGAVIYDGVDDPL